MEKPKLISTMSLRELSSYLNAHEDDIADEINDFGVLKEIFKELLGREPEKGDPNV